MGCWILVDILPQVHYVAAVVISPTALWVVCVCAHAGKQSTFCVLLLLLCNSVDLRLEPL